eukprot:5781028-Prymnesium_polylepis.1
MAAEELAQATRRWRRWKSCKIAGACGVTLWPLLFTLDDAEHFESHPPCRRTPAPPPTSCTAIEPAPRDHIALPY